MDVLTPEQRRRNMQAIKSSGTRMEQKLAIALWEKGYRFRRNSAKILGKPDLSLKRIKLAVFIDSEFFHGKNWDVDKYRIKTNREFWWPKIEGNIRRDKEVTSKLMAEGWIVLRFWSREVQKNLDYCIREIEQRID